MFKKASESAPVDMEPKLNYMRRLSNMFRHEKRRESIDDFISQVIDKNERKEKMPATAKFTKANTVGDFAQQTGSEDFYGRGSESFYSAETATGTLRKKNGTVANRMKMFASIETIPGIIRCHGSRRSIFNQGSKAAKETRELSERSALWLCYARFQ